MFGLKYEQHLGPFKAHFANMALTQNQSLPSITIFVNLEVGFSPEIAVQITKNSPHSHCAQITAHSYFIRGEEGTLNVCICSEPFYFGQLTKDLNDI